MGAYYDLIMEPIEGTFTRCFNVCWHDQLNELVKPYSDAVQLQIGNQLRPKLTCWGAAFNTDSVGEIDLNQTAQIASHVEMVHKASLIIDDIVDNDDARRGQKAFHIEFGRDKAIMFSLVLLSKGMAGINRVLHQSNSHYCGVALYSDTIYHMALGCLEELELNHTSMYDIEKIRRIINYETIALIKNSFLLGYWSNWDGNSTLEKTLVEIGENCGYIFQVLNDLEPFSDSDSNFNYKGGRNIDINRDRKNIVVAYVYGAATPKEKKLLTTLSGEPLQHLILELYRKYSVFDAICHEAMDLEQRVDEQITDIKQVGRHISCIEDFRMFVHEVIDICFSRLGQAGAQLRDAGNFGQQIHNVNNKSDNSH